VQQAVHVLGEVVRQSHDQLGHSVADVYVLQNASLLRHRSTAGRVSAVGKRIGPVIVMALVGNPDWTVTIFSI
jgi:hypothetical protein